MPHLSPTKLEIEIKLRIADLPSLVRNLWRLGATPAGRVLEKNTLYDTPASDFRRRGRLLRLRTETPAPSAAYPGGPHRVILTSKAPASAGPVRPSAVSRGPLYKERLERELVVHDPRGWPAVLCSVGLRPRFRYEKYRTSFRLFGLHLDLDETPVGIFLELEGAPRSIDRVARALGFSPEDYIRETYWALYRTACRRRGRRPGNMVFHT